MGVVSEPARRRSGGTVPGAGLIAQQRLGCRPARDLPQLRLNGRSTAADSPAHATAAGYEGGGGRAQAASTRWRPSLGVASPGPTPITDSDPIG